MLKIRKRLCFATDRKIYLSGVFTAVCGLMGATRHGVHLFLCRIAQPPFFLLAKEGKGQINA